MITFENRNCMEAMKEFPDKFFDLAIVDPPYGDGLHAENGGGKGWFTKYNMKLREDTTHTHTMNECLNASADAAADLSDTSDRQKVGRTRGAWAKKYGKKS